MRFIPPILLHLLPLVPLALGRYYGTVAALLLVALPYIKVYKLQADLAFREANALQPDDPTVRRKTAAVQKRLELYLGFTFLPWIRARRQS